MTEGKTFYYPCQKMFGALYTVIRAFDIGKVYATVLTEQYKLLVTNLLYAEKNSPIYVPLLEYDPLYFYFIS